MMFGKCWVFFFVVLEFLEVFVIGWWGSEIWVDFELICGSIVSFILIGFDVVCGSNVGCM